MKNKLKLLIIPSVFALILPVISFATAKIPFWGPLVPCGPGTAISSCRFCDLFTLGQNLISFGITLVIVILAPIAIAIGGFLVITAGSSPDRLQKGKQTITFAIIGIVVALASFVIINTFMWVIGATTIQGTGTQTINGQSWSWFNFSCPK